MLPIAMIIAVNVGTGIADRSMLLASNEANIGRSSVNLLSSACNFSDSIVSSLASFRSDMATSRESTSLFETVWVLWIATGNSENALLVTKLITSMDASSVIFLNEYWLMVWLRVTRRQERCSFHGQVDSCPWFDWYDQIGSVRGAWRTRFELFVQANVTWRIFSDWLGPLSLCTASPCLCESPTFCLSTLVRVAFPAK